MKIAATASGCGQVSQEQFRDWNRTRIFDETATFADLSAWAKSVLGAQADWQDLSLSVVDHEPAKPDAPAEVARLLKVARGCHDYNGGYRNREAEVYHHGIDTVINALEATERNPNDTQIVALERIGANQK